MSLKTKCYFLLIVTLCVCSFIGLDRAQAQTAKGELVGRVFDPSGSAVPSADISLVNVATGVERKTTSNAVGDYTFTYLEVGTYRLTVRKPGFRPTEETNINLAVNQSLTWDVMLTLGSTVEVVKVTAATEMLNNTTSELGELITQKEVLDLPLNGRNFTNLITLAAGFNAVETAQGPGGGTSGASDPIIPGSWASRPAVNGQWNRADMYLLDGVNNYDSSGSTYGVMPIIDSIEEIKVQAHNDEAQYGGAPGGTVNVVTKSGTNKLHGSGWEFVRNADFDARDPFADATTSKPAMFRQNQFGMTIGGPIEIPKLYDGSNRTFFFFAYEGWRYSKAAQSLYTVPTAAELSGDFSQSIIHQNIYDPTTTVVDPANPSALIRTQFSYDGIPNVIPPDRISPMMVAYFKTYYDRPNYSASSVFNCLNTLPLTDNDNEYSIRIDHRIKEKDFVFFRYTGQYDADFAPETLSSYEAFLRPMASYAWGENHTFRPNLLLDVRVGYARQPNNSTSPNSNGTGPAAAAGFAGIPSYGLPIVLLSAPWPTSQPGAPAGAVSDQKDEEYHVAADLTYLRGSHHMSFGIQYIPEIRTVGPLNAQQSYAFQNTQTENPEAPARTGASLASALLGLPYTAYTQQLAFRMATYAQGFYAQDQWKIRKNVTVTYGLRYDRLRTVHLDYGSLYSEPDPDTGIWLLGGGVLPQPCSVVGKAPCIPGDGTLASIPEGQYIQLASNPDILTPGKRDFGPRLGIAWRASNKTVVRAGYGLVYDVFQGLIQTAVNISGAWPNSSAVLTSYNAVGLSQPATTVEALQSQRASPLPAASPWSTFVFSPEANFKSPFSNQWNVEVQRELTDNVMFAVGYVGSNTGHLNLGCFNGNTDPTPGARLPSQENALRPFPWMGINRGFQRQMGLSNYNGLQARLDRRFSHGLQFMVNYTYSKSIDDGASWYGVEAGAGAKFNVVQDYYDPAASRSPSGFDVTHYLNASGVWDLPVGKGRRWLPSGPAAYVLGGWQMSTLLTARSGQPYNLGISGDVANIGDTNYAYARPNLIGNPVLSHPTVAQWFNQAAFSVPVNSFGNFGRNVLRADDLADVDYALFKTVRLWNESSHLEIRGEVFNVFNIINYNAPDGTVFLATSGLISKTSHIPRQAQLAVKFVF